MALRNCLVMALLKLASAAGGDEARLYLFSTSSFPHARCLDGSQSGLYLRPPVAGQPADNWLVVLDGGGLCSQEKDCVARSTTKLGSSSGWAPTYTKAQMEQIAFFSRSARNPFRDWGHVFVPYCAGDMHSGRRTNATNATFGLYFSGFHTTMAVVDFLVAHHGLGNRSDQTLIWSGGSAGGVGVFSTVDSVAERLPSVRVVGAPVAGFPPDITWYDGPHAAPPEEDVRTPSFRDRLVPLYESILPQACVAAKSAERAYECAVPHLVYPYIQSDLFIIQALTDVVILGGFEGVPAAALAQPIGWRYVNAYGANATEAIRSGPLTSARHGVFAPACLLHTNFTLDGPLIGGVNAVEALHEWLVGSTPGNRSHRIDECHIFYPPQCGSACPYPPIPHTDDGSRDERPLALPLSMIQ